MDTEYNGQGFDCHDEAGIENALYPGEKYLACNRVKVWFVPPALPGAIIMKPWPMGMTLSDICGRAVINWK